MVSEAVTTFTRSGYELHAEKFLDSWNWIPIHCYEEPLLNVRNDRLVYEYDLECESPQLVEFKKTYGLDIYRGKRGSSYSYIYDAVKWSHRIFALAAQARKSEADILINIDSDIVVFDTPPQDFAEQLLGDADIAYMPRKTMYSECSFVVYRMTDLVRKFIDHHERAYTEGAVFTMKEGWTDCHIFDAILPVYEALGVKTRNINEGVPDSMHPFVNGPLGKYMDHMKGQRKREGKSRKADLVVSRQEKYWTY